MPVLWPWLTIGFTPTYNSMSTLSLSVFGLRPGKPPIKLDASTFAVPSIVSGENLGGAPSDL
jgi:hypothetical protein